MFGDTYSTTLRQRFSKTRSEQTLRHLKLALGTDDRHYDFWASLSPLRAQKSRLVAGHDANLYCRVTVTYYNNKRTLTSHLSYFLVAVRHNTRCSLRPPLHRQKITVREVLQNETKCRTKSNENEKKLNATKHGWTRMSDAVFLKRQTKATKPNKYYPSMAGAVLDERLTR